MDRCGFILDETQKAYDSVVMNMQKPSGPVRVCMFRDLYKRLLKKAGRLVRVLPDWSAGGLR